MELQYIGFMAAIRHTEIDYVENTLKEYEIGNYLIGMEVTNTAHHATEGQHMHFVVQMKDDDYHRFAKRVFKDKYKLNGQARDGVPRQYGKIRKIENLEKMFAYSMKDGKIRSNMSQDQLDKYFKLSFEKKDELNFEQQMLSLIQHQFNMVHTTDKYGNHNLFKPSYTAIGVKIIGYIREKGVHPYTKMKLDRLIMTYMYYYCPDTNNYSDLELFKKYFPFEN